MHYNWNFSSWQGRHLLLAGENTFFWTGRWASGGSCWLVLLLCCTFVGRKLNHSGGCKPPLFSHEIWNNQEPRTHQWNSHQSSGPKSQRLHQSTGTNSQDVIQTKPWRTSTPSPGLSSYRQPLQREIGWESSQMPRETQGRQQQDERDLREDRNSWRGDSPIPIVLRGAVTCPTFYQDFIACFRFYCFRLVNKLLSNKKKKTHQWPPKKCKSSWGIQQTLEAQKWPMGFHLEWPRWIQKRRMERINCECPNSTLKPNRHDIIIYTANLMTMLEWSTVTMKMRMRSMWAMSMACIMCNYIGFTKFVKIKGAKYNNIKKLLRECLK